MRLHLHRKASPRPHYILRSNVRSSLNQRQKDTEQQQPHSLLIVGRARHRQDHSPFGLGECQSEKLESRQLSAINIEHWSHYICWQIPNKIINHAGSAVVHHDFQR